jgi:hypothetical protein
MLTLTREIFQEKSRIVSGLHKNDKKIPKTLQWSDLMFGEMQILFCLFSLGHIRSYFDLKVYTNAYQGDMYMHQLFNFFQNFEIAFFLKQAPTRLGGFTKPGSEISLVMYSLHCKI